MFVLTGLKKHLVLPVRFGCGRAGGIFPSS
jgi:hypothetical protein